VVEPSACFYDTQKKFDHPNYFCKLFRMERKNTLPPFIPTAVCGGAFVKSCEPVKVTVHQLADMLGRMVDARDHYTRRHSIEVAEIARMLAWEMGLSMEMAEEIHIAGHLHDIGKIGVRDAVLWKTEELTPQELEEIRQHPVIGYQALRQIPFLSRNGGVAEMVLHHHERYDGMGYPSGLAGEEIPLGSRVLAVADSFSAMAGDRPYRKGMPFELIGQEIQRNASTQFDPMVVEAYLGVESRIVSLWERLSNSSLKKPSMAFSTVGWPKQVSANLSK